MCTWRFQPAVAAPRRPGDGCARADRGSGRQLDRADDGPAGAVHSPSRKRRGPRVSRDRRLPRPPPPARYCAETCRAPAAAATMKALPAAPMKAAPAAPMKAAPAAPKPAAVRKPAKRRQRRRRRSRRSKEAGPQGRERQDRRAGRSRESRRAEHQAGGAEKARPAARSAPRVELEPRACSPSARWPRSRPQTLTSRAAEVAVLHREQQVRRSVGESLDHMLLGGDAARAMPGDRVAQKFPRRCS